LIVPAVCWAERASSKVRRGTEASCWLRMLSFLSTPISSRVGLELSSLVEPNCFGPGLESSVCANISPSKRSARIFTRFNPGGGTLLLLHLFESFSEFQFTLPDQLQLFRTFFSRAFALLTLVPLTPTFFPAMSRAWPLERSGIFTLTDFGLFFPQVWQ
jgi:hypothetical protein